MKRFETISDLTNPEILGSLVGPVESIAKTALSVVGYSGSVLERIELTLQSGTVRKLILKCTRLRTDWLSQRARDQLGREAAFLSESGLSGLWDMVHCPYVAFSSENGVTGLLMDDFTDYLFPDVREPIDKKSEDLILNTLASFHSSFWESSLLKKEKWMMQGHQYLEVLGPGEHPSDRFAPPPDKIKHSMQEGWKLALGLLPGPISHMLRKSAIELFAPWKELPMTLLHGDAKIANMAILPTGKLVLFDWTYVGYGPCGIELGWFLAVNSTRLANSKEDLCMKYRSCLESKLKFRIDEKTWTNTLELAVVTGAMMMLWSKALAYQSGTERGRDEWTWWVTHLEKIESTHQF
jgi:thiamine kinase-like enzyme